MYDPRYQPRKKHSDDPNLEANIRNERDEAFARRIREIIGTRRRLVSWEPIGDGRWEARFSCEALPFTVRREGASRVAAIDRAIKAANRLLNLRSAAFSLDHRLSRRDFERD